MAKKSKKEEVKTVKKESKEVKKQSLKEIILDKKNRKYVYGIGIALLVIVVLLIVAVALKGNNDEKENANIYKVGELIINDDTKEVICEGKNVKLTPTEYNILKFLVKNKGKVFSISQIYENVWEEESFGTDNIIAVHIRHIREKIEINPKEPRYLKVIWGIGYKIEDLK